MDAFGTAVNLGQKYRDGVERMEVSIDPRRTGMARRQDSNMRPTYSKCKNLKIQKCRNYKQLNLFNFFNQLLVSFGTV